MKMKELVNEWRNEHSVIDEWLDNFQPNTQKHYATYSYLYFKWIETAAPEPYRGKTPEDLLDLQDRCVRQRERFAQVELLKKWINTRKGSYGTKLQLKTVVYAFYASNHVPLPKDVNWKAKPDHATVNGSMTIEEIKQIVLSSNKLYQAVFTVMFQSSMGLEELMYFNTHSWPQIKKQLDEGKQLIRIDLPGRKHRNKKPGGAYFTFFGKDAITKLKEYLEVRGQHTREINRDLPKLEDAIFITENWRPLTKYAIMSYFKRHAWMLSLTKRRRQDKFARYRVHVHELRDTFKTELETVPLLKSYCIEFWLGHSIDKNEYHKVMNRSDFVKAQYKKAEPYLNILSEDPRVEKVEDLEKIIEKRVAEQVSNLEARYISYIRGMEAREEKQIDDLVEKVRQRLEAEKTKS